MKLQKKVIDKDGRPTSDKIYNIEECLDKIPKISEIENRTSAIEGKLNGIEAGAEVNQNAFSNVKVGPTIIEADSKKDTLELVAGSNITLTPDAPNDKITIATTDTATFSNLATTNLTTINLTTNGEIEVYGTELQKQPHIDFHYSGSTEDKTSRIIETESGKIDILADKGLFVEGSKVQTKKDLASIKLDLEVYDKTLRDFSYTAKYVPVIPAVFVRFYGIFNKDLTNQTGGVQIIKFPTSFLNDYKPNYQAALSVHSSKKITLVAKSSGIYVNVMDTGLKEYAVWGAGFWFV